MHRAIPLRYGDFMGFMETRNEKGRRNKRGLKGRRKSEIGLIANVCSLRWVYLDFASASARFASRGEVTLRPDNQVIGAFGYPRTASGTMRICI